MDLNDTSLLADMRSKSIRVLLVDDQPIIAEAIRRMLESESDISFFYCQNPLEAMSMATEVSPTVILQDLVMPEVDGLTLVKYFRANQSTKNMPLVVLSSKEDSTTKYKAFENGANDYMVKLPDKLEVLARIRYHSNAYNVFCERNEAMENLQKSQQHLKQELEQAEQYVESLLPPKLDTDVLRADWIFKSSTELGGDCFGYEWIDEDNFCMFLLDVCGHGVGAALLSVSVMNVLRSQSLAGVDFLSPSQVLSALNNAFEMEKQNNMYFSLWYGVYNVKDRKLTYASGGHPPAILLSGNSSKELTTRGMIIGGIADMTFTQAEVDVPRNSRLYIFSDGVYEIQRYDTKSMMSFADFKAELVSPVCSGISKLACMLDFSVRTQKSQQFADDYSMCEIIFK